MARSYTNHSNDEQTSANARDTKWKKMAEWNKMNGFVIAISFRCTFFLFFGFTFLCTRCNFFTQARFHSIKERIRWYVKAEKIANILCYFLYFFVPYARLLLLSLRIYLWKWWESFRQPTHSKAKCKKTPKERNVRWCTAVCFRVKATVCVFIFFSRSRLAIPIDMRSHPTSTENDKSTTRKKSSSN